MRLKMVLPKGRLYDDTVELMAHAGYRVTGGDRSYRPVCSDPLLDIKIIKGQNVPRLVSLGKHDIGICGRDWLVESACDAVELMDLGYGAVDLVAAIPNSEDQQLQKTKQVLVASEFRNIPQQWLTQQGYAFELVTSYGATEAFPPEDADMIIDIAETGLTLGRNNLKIIGRILRSSARLIAHPGALADPEKSEKIEEICNLFKAVLNGRSRTLLEMNCPEDRLDLICRILPAMKAPSVSKLYGETGYAVKAAIPTASVPTVIHELLKAGATDIIEYELNKVINCGVKREMSGLKDSLLTEKCP